MSALREAFDTQRTQDRQLRVVTQRRPVLAKVGTLAAKALSKWESARTTVLAMGGFGFLTAAAWTVALPLGLAAVGVSLLVLEYLSGSE